MSSGGLLSVLIPSAVLAVAYFGIFECLRRTYTRFFAPRYPGSEDGNYPYPSVFGWFYGIFCEPEDKILQKSGMDAVVYLRFLKLSWQIMGVLSILGMFILAPIYAGGDNGESGLLRIGLSNLKQESSRLWAPALLMWIFSFFILYLIHKNYKELLEMRKVAMRKGDSSHYTTMVIKVPEEYDTEAKIAEFFDTNYPGEVAHVQLVRNLKEMDKQVKLLQKEQLKLVVARKKAETAEEPPTVKLGFCGCMGEKVEAIPHHESEVKRIRAEIEEKCCFEKSEYCHAAFVSFKNVATAVKAGGTTLTDSETWEITNATRPNDIIWGNLYNVKSRAVQDGLESCSSATLTTLLIFWAIPIAAGGALANLEQLGEDNSWLDGVNSLPPVVIAIIEGFGPTIWRVVLMILLEPIIYGLIRMTGVLEGNKLENRFLYIYYWFLLVHIYFVTLLASSIFNTIQDIVDDPTSIFQLLGEAIPGVAIEMIQYMLLQGLGVNAGKIVRIAGLALTIFFSKMAVVEYQKEKVMKPPKFKYGYDLAKDLLMWTISCAYMAVAPLILPFSFIYFFVMYLVQSYQLLHVHTPDFETYGAFWPRISGIAIGGLLLSQVALMAIIGLKFGAFQQILLFPLPIATYFFMTHIESTMGEQMRNSVLPLLNASELDKQRPRDDVDSFLARAQEIQMWTQECAQLDLQNSLKDPPSPPVLEDKKQSNVKMAGHSSPVKVEIKDVELKKNSTSSLTGAPGARESKAL
mmetsp:Transcript_23297/g.56492  ORF Transcript_23297/g.56492 Transcript_23297/m.56492 type:complete len:746 (+) Transcript_23297:57-2294(+)